MREDISQHFELFKMAVTDFEITSLDMYNIDKTGFRIEYVYGRIVIPHIYTKAVYLVDLENRESIIGVECNDTDGSTIGLMLIVKNKVLLVTHFDNSLSDEIIASYKPC